jgi:hypothetical protein
VKRKVVIEVLRNTGRTIQTRHKRNKALTSWPTREFFHDRNHIASGHEINFGSIYRLSNATSYMDCFFSEGNNRNLFTFKQPQLGGWLHVN